MAGTDCKQRNEAIRSKVLEDSFKDACDNRACELEVSE